MTRTTPFSLYSSSNGLPLSEEGCGVSTKTRVEFLGIFGSFALLDSFLFFFFFLRGEASRGGGGCCSDVTLGGATKEGGSGECARGGAAGGGACGAAVAGAVGCLLDFGLLLVLLAVFGLLLCV